MPQPVVVDRSVVMLQPVVVRTAVVQSLWCTAE
jgi:hypothetical protein